MPFLALILEKNPFEVDRWPDENAINQNWAFDAFYTKFHNTESTEALCIVYDCEMCLIKH